MKKMMEMKIKMMKILLRKINEIYFIKIENYLFKLLFNIPYKNILNIS